MKEIIDIRDIEVPLRDPTFKPLHISPYKSHNAPAVNGCTAGYNSLAIESNGDVYICRRLPIVIGNIMKDDLATSWNSEVLQKLRNRDNLKGKCGRCAYRWQCGGCRGIAYAFTGDYLAEDPYCPYPWYRTSRSLTFLPWNKKRLAL
jgi:radical SAM protein with 4Fe4S-binding SPASM domain